MTMKFTITRTFAGQYAIKGFTYACGSEIYISKDCDGYWTYDDRSFKTLAEAKAAAAVDVELGEYIAA